MENQIAFRRREAVNWALTGLTFAVAGALLLMFGAELQPAAGMASLRQYLLVPGGVLLTIGIVLLVVSGGLAGSKPWAVPLLRAISYVLLACFFLGLVIIAVIWFRKWAGQSMAAFSLEDIVALIVIALTLIFGLRGLRALRKLK